MTRLAIFAAALLLVVIFVAVGAATVRYFDRALRRQPIPARTWNAEGEPDFV